MRYIFVLAIALILVPLASAAVATTTSSLGTFKQLTDVELIQNCDNSTDLCTLCNISSIKNPDSTIIAADAAMTARTYDFNYTLHANDTRQMGEYLVSGFCSDGLNTKVWTYTFTITPVGGAEDNTTLFLIFAFAGIILLGFAYFIKNEYLAFAAGCTFLVLGVYTEIYGFGNLTNQYTRMLGMISLGIGLLFTIASIYEMLESYDEGYEVIEG